MAGSAFPHYTDPSVRAETPGGNSAGSGAPAQRGALRAYVLQDEPTAMTEELP
jgi:hypothetical protein